MIHTKISDSWTTAKAGVLWQELALGLVDRLPFGVILTDRHAQVIAMNRRASKLVVGPDGMCVLDGRISATDGMVDAALQRAIVDVLVPCGSRSPQEVRITVPISSTHRAIQVVVTSNPRGAPRAGTRNDAVLFLFGPGRLSAEANTLMDLYGLTPAEAQVACFLVAGDRPARIGVATGTTLNTVRTHIRRIFTKSGCRSQAEFVHVVLTGPAALGAEPA